MSNRAKNTQNTQNTQSEEKDTRNKATKTADLTFNVENVKRKMVDYCECNEIDKPMFSGGQTALTATLQKMYTIVINECIKRTPKNVSGTIQTNVHFLSHSILLHPGLKKYFNIPMTEFNAKQVWSEQVPISKTEMEKVMGQENKLFGLTNKAYNLICYLLSVMFSDLVSTCINLLEFAKKKAFDYRCVMYAVQMKFDDSLSCEFTDEINRVAKAFGEELEDKSSKNDKKVLSADDGIIDEEADEADEDEEAGEEEEVAKPNSKVTTQNAKNQNKQVTKTTNSKNTTTNANKKNTNANTKATQTATNTKKNQKAQVIEEEAEEDELEENDFQDEEEEQEEENEEQEEEQETKPAKNVKTVKKNGNANNGNKNAKTVRNARK